MFLSVAQALQAAGRFMQPLTDALLLGLGYMTDGLARSFIWLADRFGVDGEAVAQSMRAAQEARPQFDEQSQQGAPAFLAVFVAIFCTFFFGAILILVFHRLIGRIGLSDDDAIQETRSRTGRRGGLRDLFRFGGHRPEDDHDLDTRDSRQAIRLHYRRFQLLMARAGLPRRSAETPQEYQQGLAWLMPIAGSDLETITSSYDIARYAEPGATLPAVDEVDHAIQRLRSTVRELSDRPGGITQSQPS